VTIFTTIGGFAPLGTEAGASLILRDEAGWYLFFLAGSRHRRQCPPGHVFYAGTGGHRERGEGWPACVRREAAEEIGSGVALDSSTETWYVPHQGTIDRLSLRDRPTLAQLLAEGARLVVGDNRADAQLRLYPIGTAALLARLRPHLRERRPGSVPQMKGG